jgi:alkylation response protein AidB-like acyl-CoA dehydrogenase
VRPAALAVSDEQNALAESVRGFAEQTRLTAVAKAAADAETDTLPEGWQGLADQELLALPFDARISDLCVAIEELGRALAPGPIVPTLLAGLLVRRFGSEELQASVEAGILRFIEDNWKTGRIGGGSFDSIAGSLDSMFNFKAPHDAKVILNSSGELT